MLGKSIQIVTAAQHRLLQHRSRIPGVEDLFRRATLLREEEEEEEGLSAHASRMRDKSPICS